MPYFDLYSICCLRSSGQAFDVAFNEIPPNPEEIGLWKDLHAAEVDFPQDLYKHYRPTQFFATVFLSRPAVFPRLAQALAGGPPGSQLMAVAA
jgi:hypothetical protein